MESLVKLFNKIYKDKRVLITGHTGFKGSWLSFWLQQLGAEILGYSIDIPTVPSHYNLLNLKFRTVQGDVRDLNNLINIFEDFKPEIVFHLAAQPLVRSSYINPIATFEINIIGTANVLEAAKHTGSVSAIVNVTSDKCYENLETNIAYKEEDKLGGYDPYSASKGCAELITNSYRNSFFNNQQYQKTHQTLLASVRAGNVIGGGDWAIDRLIPDIIKATSEKLSVNIRRPNSTRPWQHVLEPLSGYLLLGQKLLEKKSAFASAWNFGPLNNEVKSVLEIITLMKKEWEDISCTINEDVKDFHESKLLKLDGTKTSTFLFWKPIWNIETTIAKTVLWYKEFYNKGLIHSHEDLQNYIDDAISQDAIWTK